MKTHPLYQPVKRALSTEPATAAELARVLCADPDATRLALEQLERRGKARHCGHPVTTERRWSAR